MYEAPPAQLTAGQAVLPAPASAPPQRKKESRGGARANGQAEYAFEETYAAVGAEEADESYAEYASENADC